MLTDLCYYRMQHNKWVGQIQNSNSLRFIKENRGNKKQSNCQTFCNSFSCGSEARRMLWLTLLGRGSDRCTTCDRLRSSSSPDQQNKVSAYQQLRQKFNSLLLRIKQQHSRSGKSYSFLFLCVLLPALWLGSLWIQSVEDIISFSQMEVLTPKIFTRKALRMVIYKFNKTAY